MTRDLSVLWLETLQDVAHRAAHEVKDSLNGVSLNIEVIRSRSLREGTPASGVAAFAEAASAQFESLSARTESLLFLVRRPRAAAPEDVAATLRHLATLLVPAARADGGQLEVEVPDRSVPTAAPGVPVRLALARGLTALMDVGGSGRCRLDGGTGTVVRFSHESAGACRIEPAIAALIAEYDITTEMDPAGNLLLRFPGA